MSGGPEPILLSILLIIIGAKLGGEAAERLKQPAVLGELLVGVILGAGLLGGFIGMPDFAIEQEFHHAEEIGEAGIFYEAHGGELDALAILGALATIGVILLLFEVGMESDIKELTKVGASSLLVGLIGIVASFAVGYGFSWGLAEVWDSWAAADAAIPNNLLHIFIGATLTATSVGITARVLGDMGRLNTNETKIILGAAVIDDIGGLIILAIVAALIAAATGGDPVSAGSIILIAGKAIGFLLVSIFVGIRFIPQAYDYAVDRFKVAGFPVALAIGFALLMAYLATLFGLADIVGAFAGGLLLAQSKHTHKVFEELRPIAAIFVSFFFVTLGMKVDLRDLGDNIPLLIAASLVLVAIAIVAKLACGWGITKGTKASKLVVGVGMAPRGEVGLIFASLGLSLGLIAGWQYTMVIIVVMGTTFVTPIWLGKLNDRFLGVQDDEADQRTKDASNILKA